ncbi:hypothetical protein [Corynebacterium sp.]|uniref:hypothetical protein n=1 Tax=Corynebacterium sp. TaxID=1720 RepID=UPI0026DFD47D|nr:hypothetical protein [Corynebacterium sp.]MDO5512429.1 hypothetical protein [Corynebacterium sp.]
MIANTGLWDAARTHTPELGGDDLEQGPSCSSLRLHIFRVWTRMVHTTVSPALKGTTVIAEDLSALGFDANTWEDLMDMSMHREPRGVEDFAGFDWISPYTDPSGARLLRTLSGDDWSTSASFVATQSIWPARVGRINDFTSLIDLLNPAGEIFTRLTASLDDSFLYPVLNGPQDTETGMADATLQVAGLVMGADIYPDADAWKAKLGAERPVADTPDGPLTVFGEPGFILGPWTFEYFGGGEPDTIESYNQVCLEVDTVDTRTNELTGRQFHVATGQLQEGLPPLEMCLPVEMAPDLAPGNVVEGAVLIVANSGYWDEVLAQAEG